MDLACDTLNNYYDIYRKYKYLPEKFNTAQVCYIHKCIYVCMHLLFYFFHLYICHLYLHWSYVKYSGKYLIVEWMGLISCGQN